MRRFIVMGGMLAAGVLSGCATGAPTREALVAETPQCAAHRFDIYFAEGQARLTPDAAQAIALAGERMRPCRIETVRVLGLADATGASEANLSLSQQRARTTAQALAAAGFPTPAFDVAAGGDQNAVTDAGAAEPLRRRTEIVIAARPH
ncbi:OmpA family protein [uncultured Brevundimonas sp.]|uniref:OmpA family protein n=1 Tax=uncultured Brevundimonas sp. TaxID=213418 RepID=UPI0025F291F9|nr:OmpA family protein [uncultured Brevundimonas sp.]